MRVTCPECGAKFKVPDKALGSTGRKLRCGKCTHEWFQEPGAPEAPAMPVAGSKPRRRQKPEPRPASPPEPPARDISEDLAGTPEPADTTGGAFALRAARDDAIEPPPLGGISRFRGPRSEPPKRRLPVALLVLAAAVPVIPAILFAARDHLVEAWPASALLYDSVGLHVPAHGEGLILQNVYVQRRQEGNVPLLVVAGEIRNPTDRLLSLPALRGTLLDEHGDPLQSWRFGAEVPQLLPGDIGRFQSELAAPSGSASRVNVTFTHERAEGGIGY